MSHMRMATEDVADVALHWCTDDDISHEGEQKHQSGDNVAVPAIVRPLQLCSSSDEEDISMKKLMHVREYVMVSWLQARIVYDRNRTTWKYSLSSWVGRTLGHKSFAATTAVPTRISKNIGSLLQYLRWMEALHFRSNSSFSCQIQYTNEDVYREGENTRACVS